VRRRHPDHQPINTCSSERHNILGGTDHVIESDEHTDFKALGTDVFNPLQQRRQVLGASDIYAVGMLDRHRNRRPSRCTNDDARLGRTINDPRETVERRVGVAGMVGVSSPDFAQGRNRVDQGRSSFSRGSELGSNRVSLANLDPGAAPEPTPSRTRPLATDCSVLTAAASCAGCRFIMFATRRPMSIPVVIAAMAPRQTNGSRDQRLPTIAPLK
jgi:hypothetical protein